MYFWSGAEYTVQYIGLDVCRQAGHEPTRRSFICHSHSSILFLSVSLPEACIVGTVVDHGVYGSSRGFPCNMWLINRSQVSVLVNSAGLNVFHFATTRRTRGTLKVVTLGTWR